MAEKSSLSERLSIWTRLLSYLRRGKAELFYLIVLSLLLGTLQLAEIGRASCRERV